MPGLSGWCGLHGKPDCRGCERHGCAASCACPGCAKSQAPQGFQRGSVAAVGENGTSPNGAQTPPGSDRTFLIYAERRAGAMSTPDPTDTSRHPAPRPTR